MNDPGLLIVVSGPSGAGKGTICNALRKRFPNIYYSISMTTREPRNGEVDGINYFFTDNLHFEELIRIDSFLEYAQVYEHYYGTPKEYVFNMLQQGKNVMLEIDIQGAMQIKNKYPKAVFIYVIPPSLDVLTNRLKSRHTDSANVIARRLAKVKDELEWLSEYEYVVINDELELAVERAAAIIVAEQCKVSRNHHLITSIHAQFKD
ncbi:guanylate kinase [Megasphaera paucivorans]|uniref:Guanylate kinase n=1 Tax=Megasphaera paucivorans TaxID=349095 RepID=A0A1G9VHD9_9FIRM|nr:guanylate kinase [Megasphaera paucivorans]SDM71559.1 guanylate kinase [Megasphaera paucivorans]